MKALLAALALAVALPACSGRQVAVTSEPVPQAAPVTLRVVNSLDQAVNVYVVSDGKETFVKQVAAKTTDEAPVPGVSVGAQVTLRATPVDGSRNYSRQATLNGLYEWRVP
ncbi:MAG TPA: hypothetical protein VFY16_01660 [Gemmatimonadaceae bacterium]|nr:hypothetical protein [Gemmatimonadaceae bacterium]